MPIQYESKPFKDISLSFKKHPVTNDLIVLKNQDAIKKSVINLVRTAFDDRFYQPDLGTSVSDSLFDLLESDLIPSVVEAEIRSVLINYEPRIQLKNIIVEGRGNTLSTTIDYIIVGQPDTSQSTQFLIQA